MSKAVIEAPPQAGRVMEGFRDTGYTASSALCDVIDNSISAEATQIAVDILVTGGTDPRVELFISDNGTGMNPGQLTTAMN